MFLLTTCSITHFSNRNFSITEFLVDNLFDDTVSCKKETFSITTVSEEKPFDKTIYLYNTVLWNKVSCDYTVSIES